MVIPRFKKKSVEVKFYDMMLQKHYLVSTAESCTGGMISARIINVPGSSDIINEAFVVYSNKAKINRLHVQSDTLETYGAVSGECVKEMAENLHKLTYCDLSIAVSGIAGPTGGTPMKPVGTVWFAFGINGNTTVEKKHFYGNRQSIRKQATVFAIEKATELIQIIK